MYKCLINTNLSSLFKLNDKTGVTSPNIRKTRIILIMLHVIQHLYSDHYENRAKPSPWLVL